MKRKILGLPHSLFVSANLEYLRGKRVGWKKLLLRRLKGFQGGLLQHRFNARLGSEIGGLWVYLGEVEFGIQFCRSLFLSIRQIEGLRPEIKSSFLLTLHILLLSFVQSPGSLEVQVTNIVIFHPLLLDHLILIELLRNRPGQLISEADAKRLLVKALFAQSAFVDELQRGELLEVPVALVLLRSEHQFELFELFIRIHTHYIK